MGESMVSILLDGLSILDKYLGGIIIFFIGIYGFGLRASKFLIHWQEDRRIQLFAAFGVGAACLCVAAFFIVFLSHFWPFLLQPGSYAILLIAGYSMFKELRECTWSNIKIALIGGIAIFLLLIIRLAFLKHILLPPYSDSPIHYQIITGFLHPERSAVSKLAFETLLTDYYHFGFHSLVAWLTTITNYDPSDMISLVGQLFLVIAPVSVFVLAYISTKNGIAALFAGLLAAIGWDMPAFAINWGKFPAISSLAILPSVVALLTIYFLEPGSKKSGLLWAGVLMAGVTLIHTRAVVCVLLGAACFIVARALMVKSKLGFFQSTRFSLLYLVSLWPLLPILSDFYARVVVFIVLLLLLPFAFQYYPKLAFGIFLFTFGLWLIGIAPTLITGNDRRLLDSQFLEIMLYIPFSVMGSAGFAGFLAWIPVTSILRQITVILFLGSVTINFLPDNSVYPDSCCNYFSEGDQTAFQWIGEESTDHTLFLISSFEENGRVIGTDAGIWLFPLLGQPTNKLPFNLDWNSPDELEKICQLNARDIYIYMGGRNYSFDKVLLSKDIRTRLVFKEGKTQIYRMGGCSR
jgi:hypothetical protein